MKILTLSTFIIFTCRHSVIAEYDLHIESNSPVVTGGTVRFRSVLKDDGEDATGSFKYEWQDNGLPQHSREVETESAHDTWNVTYSGYPPGPYEVQLVAYEYTIFFYRQITSNRLIFVLTDTLNGDLELIQNNKSMENFVSNNESVTHEIVLKPSDLDYLNKSSSMVLTYWFIDCQYYGITNDYKFPFKYNATEVKHKIEALVVAGYEPITTPAPSTTVTPPTTTSTTAKPTTTAVTTTTTKKLENSGKSVSSNETKSVHRRQIEDDLEMKPLPDKIRTFTDNAVSSNKSSPFNTSFPFICNSTSVPLSVNNTYGYFSKVVTVKSPVSSLSITGNNWLQQGNMLKISVNCKGSKMFKYCVMFYGGVYNITGNETCSHPLQIEACDFSINRYYGVPGKHTIVIVISNDITKLISPVTVTVYKVTKQAQLSVIVVPVVFSLVAVVLIVFGVAYYLQNRTRFIVEVADFNFGPQSMEYMTFRERLRDSLVNAFTRASISKPETGSTSRVWPPSHRYGSMT